MALPPSSLWSNPGRPEKGIPSLLSYLVCQGGGELGRVLTARTRHEDVLVGSVATSVSLTVLAVSTHPSSGHTDGTANEVFCEHFRSHWGVAGSTDWKFNSRNIVVPESCGWTLVQCKP